MDFTPGLAIVIQLYFGFSKRSKIECFKCGFQATTLLCRLPIIIAAAMVVVVVVVVVAAAMVVVVVVVVAAAMVVVVEVN